MFNSNFYKKKLRKIILPINKILESFFTELNRSKSQSSKQTPFKKKFIYLDHKIESFFDKFKNLKKYNQNKKKIYYVNSKFGIAVSLIIILFFTYFFIPSFYNKNKVKEFLVNQVSNKYDIKIKFNEKIKYGLFPKPFFYTKNLDIKYDNKVFANSDYVKFNITFKNFFSFKTLEVKDLVFKNNEFNINANNKDFFQKTLNDYKNKEKIIFIKSKSFFTDKDENLLFLSKVKSLIFFYDDKNQTQKVKSDLEIFNVPFNLTIIEDYYSKKKNIKVNSKKIRLNVETSVEYEDESILGDLKIAYFNKENLFKYKIKSETLNFVSTDKRFQGNLNFKPFYLSTNLNFNYLSQKKIFKNESLLVDLLDSELLNNPNLNAIIRINVDEFEYLKNFFLQILLDDGKIVTNNFDAKWNEAVSITSNDIELINDQDGKKLVGEIKFKFDDIEKFFRYFQIKRNYRDVFKEIKADFIYDFMENRIIFNNLKMDDKSYQKLTDFVQRTNKKNKNLFNKVTLRNFVKEFFQIYAG